MCSHYTLRVILVDVIVFRWSSTMILIVVLQPIWFSDLCTCADYKLSALIFVFIHFKLSLRFSGFLDLYDIRGTVSTFDIHCVYQDVQHIVVKHINDRHNFFIGGCSANYIYWRYHILCGAGFWEFPYHIPQKLFIDFRLGSSV